MTGCRTKFELIRDALREYGDFSAWLFTANEDEKHAVATVEQAIGRTVLDQLAENVCDAIDASEEP